MLDDDRGEEEILYQSLGFPECSNSSMWPGANIFKSTVLNCLSKPNYGQLRSRRMQYCRR